MSLQHDLLCVAASVTKGDCQWVWNISSVPGISLYMYLHSLRACPQDRLLTRLKQYNNRVLVSCKLSFSSLLSEVVSLQLYIPSKFQQCPQVFPGHNAHVLWEVWLRNSSFFFPKELSKGNGSHCNDSSYLFTFFLV